MATESQDVQINYKVNADDATKKTNAFTGSLEKLGSLIKTGLIAAFAALVTAVGLGIKEISDGEKVTAKLNQALVNTGKYTKETSKALQDYATAMQKKIAFDDEAIIAAEASFAAFGLEQSQIEELTKVTADLAQAKGMDLASAADLVAKSVGSSTNAMARYGITIEGAAGSSQRVSGAIAGLSQIFGGQAEAFGKTFPGQIAIFKNEVMNTAGAFTSFLMPAFTQGITIANQLLASFNKFVTSSGMAEFMGMLGDAFNSALTFIRPFWDSFAKWATAIWPSVKNTFTSLFSALNDIFGILNDLGVGGVVKYVFDAILVGATAVLKVIEALVGAIAWLANGLKSLTDKKVSVESENKTTTESSTADTSAPGADGVSLDSVAAQEDAKTELLLAKSEERKALLDEQALAQREMDASMREEWNLIDDEEDLIRFEEKLAKLNQNGEVTLIQEAMLQQRMNDLKAQNYQKDFLQYLGIEKLKRIEKQTTVQNMQTWEDFMVSGTRSKNKEILAIQKAMAIKNIAIQTAQAAMAAFNSFASIPIVGTVLGFIAAAATVAFGAEQVAAVNSQTTELAEGGSMIVDSPTSIGNNVLAGEAGPERIDVTPLDQQQPQTINNYIMMDGEVIATQVLKVGQGQRAEGTLDDGL